MDVVYICKHAEHNPELKYSLRSLSNMAHDQVAIAGYKPRWVTGVRHLPVTQVPGQKHPNAIANIRAVLESPEVSDPFIRMNDDFFVMSPQAHPPVYNWGLLAEVLRDGPETIGELHLARMRATYDLLVSMGFSDPVSYELHAPIVMHKKPVLEALDAVAHLHEMGVWAHYVTVYGNMYGLGGDTLPNDIKIRHPYARREDWWDTTPFLSTLDNAFTHGHIGRFIRQRFPTKSPYEV